MHSASSRMTVLAAAVAHEFNEELTIILNNADLALSSLPAGHPARQWLAEVDHAAQRCAGVTSGLLDWTRRNASRPQNISIHEFIALV